MGACPCLESRSRHQPSHLDDIMQRFKDALFIFGVLVAPSLITLAVLASL